MRPRVGTPHPRAGSGEPSPSRALAAVHNLFSGPFAGGLTDVVSKTSLMQALADVPLLGLPGRAIV